MLPEKTDLLNLLRFSEESIQQASALLTEKENCMEVLPHLQHAQFALRTALLMLTEPQPGDPGPGCE